MKNIFYLAVLYVLGCVLAACQTTTSHPTPTPAKAHEVVAPPRMPSSAPRSTYLKTVNQCGRIEYSESNYYARDPEFNGYSMTLDCNQDKKISKADGNFAINIPSHHMGSANRQWLTDIKRMNVNSKKKARYNPYVCVTVQASSDPCRSRRNVIGFAPQFAIAK